MPTKDFLVAFWKTLIQATDPPPLHKLPFLLPPFSTLFLVIQITVATDSDFRPSF